MAVEHFLLPLFEAAAGSKHNVAISGEMDCGTESVKRQARSPAEIQNPVVVNAQVVCSLRRAAYSHAVLRSTTRAPSVGSPFWGRTNAHTDAYPVCTNTAQSGF